MIDQTDVKHRIATFLNLPESKLGGSAVLTDLVTDSFVLVEMVMELQDDLGVHLIQEDLKDVKTVDDLVRLFASDARQ